MRKIIEARGLKLEVDHEVYTPREDSFMMIDEIKMEDISTDHFMEVGPGSGIISLSLASPSSTVVCCDISFSAARQTHSNANLNGCDNFMVVTSSLLTPFRKGSLPQTIIFNPPYLPEDPEIDPYSPKYEVLQLVGGPKGYETVSEILGQLPSQGTQLYTILSSLATNPIEYGRIHPEWSMKVLAAKNMGFETIWVMRIRGD